MFTTFLLKNWPVNLLVLAVFGVILPLLKGLDFFDPLILGAYTCLGPVFASPAAASRLDAPSLSTALARIAFCVAYGEMMALGMTALGIATVYFSHRNGVFFPPAVDLLLETAGLGLVLTAALSALGVWLTMRFSPGIAKLLLRIVFLGLLAWFFLRGRSLLLGISA